MCVIVYLYTILNTKIYTSIILFTGRQMILEANTYIII